MYAVNTPINVYKNDRGDKASILTFSDDGQHKYAIYTPLGCVQNERMYKTFAGAERWLNRHGWQAQEA